MKHCAVHFGKQLRPIASIYRLRPGGPSKRFAKVMAITATRIFQTRVFHNTPTKSDQGYPCGSPRIGSIPYPCYPKGTFHSDTTVISVHGYVYCHPS